MCIAIDNSVGKQLSDAIIDNCVTINPHGFAFYDIENDKLYKTMNSKDMIALLSQKIPYVAHCRKATVGSVEKSNIHLFQVGDWLIAMNGTIGGFANSKENDTKELIKALEYVRPDSVVEFLSVWEARFLLINRKTKQIIRTGQWTDKDGVFFSKTDIFNTYSQGTTYYSGYSNNWSKAKNSTTKSTETQKHIEYYDSASKKWVKKSSDSSKEEVETPKTIKLAAYGTMKLGNRNHYLIQDSKFISKGRTELPFQMCVINREFPVVLHGEDKNGATKLKVELYEVDTKVFNDICVLKGVEGGLCKKKMVKVNTAKGPHHAWMFTYSAKLDTKNYIQEYVEHANS
jgi:gamma-glutamylcyclotransferase (GGCT)/AIG2-like uncharacterized protein YtfP